MGEIHLIKNITALAIGRVSFYWASYLTKTPRELVAR